MANSIPIRNLYYLFCYAWDRFPEGKSIEVGQTKSPEIVDLFADILIKGINRLLRRGLDRGYVEIEEDTTSIRGRINLAETIRRNLLFQARVACRLDELQHDVLQNQIIKSTLRNLANCDRLAPKLATDLMYLHRRLDGITDIRLSNRFFHTVQLSRNTGHYDLLLKICKLVHECLLPVEGGKKSKFADILKDEAKMSTIFEHFIFNFYRLEQKQFVVKRDVFPWDVTAANEDQIGYLPTMKTDVSLRSTSRTIILDAKYYTQTLSQYMGGEKIKSENLYQIFAYLKNLEHRKGPDGHAEGILLYPTVGKSLDLKYEFGTHSIRVKTIDLTSDWREIREQLLGIISSPMDQLVRQAGIN